jgi:hypothetical protein
MKIHIPPEDVRRWEIESQQPEGPLTEVTVSDLCICEGMGCYSGITDIHAHVTATWANGAKRREPISMSREEQRAWLVRHRPDLLSDWEDGADWLINQ